MPELDWNIFEGLPGDPTKNWELLCRELVRRNYERFGVFRSSAQQPGIEFHLALNGNCALGDSPQHWGWQCRWYALPSGKAIGPARRKKIEAAIRTTEKDLPDVTDWVLWTRRPLTPADQKWFFGIKTTFTLRLWCDKEVIGLLAGEAEILKATYFGELVLTSNRFQRMHDEAIAPIKQRWEPQLHVEVEVERYLKSALGLPGTWSGLREASDRLQLRATTIQAETPGLRADEQDLVKRLSTLLANQSSHLTKLADALDARSLDDVWKTLADSVVPDVKKREVAIFSAKLRSVNHPASLTITAASWDVRSYLKLINELTKSLEQTFFVVVGDAGFGKTYLAAELTKPASPAPGGVLLQGKYLSSNGTLDDLVRRVPFGGDQMDQLLESVEAAGARSGRRIPIVIDGLNESENPRDWQDLLAALRRRLAGYKYCVVVVTLRSAIIDDALPSDAAKLHLTGFKYEMREAVDTYFDYYNIDRSDVPLPCWARFHSPLFLSLFCQAVNPDRKRVVGVARGPRSLTAVFEMYREVVVGRAAVKLKMAQQDIERALGRVGLKLWEANARALDFDTMRAVVGDQPRDWINSLARVLEEEGILTRDVDRRPPRDVPVEHEGNQVSALLYDAFAGFVIADAIITEQGQARFSDWVNENWSRLDLSAMKRHPLAEDILDGFVGLLPRRLYQQLWKSVPSPLREAALLATTDLEGERIDEETAEQLAELCKTGPLTRNRDVFLRLWYSRSAPSHALNAEFLSKVLFGMEVAQRDLIWTEWLRQNREEVVNDLEFWAEEWTHRTARDESDRLRALWMSWTLTSSVRYLRDHATKSLYWYGLRAQKSFFEMTVALLGTNDLYIPERMLAACYGIVMGMQVAVEELREPLAWFLGHIIEQLLGANALSPTNHWMTRQYVNGIFDFAKKLVPCALPASTPIANGQLKFGQGPYVPAIDVIEQYNGHLTIDFENDEIGRLFPTRSRYDFGHPEYAQAVREIKGRIRGLGWRDDRFETIDKNIRERHSRLRNEPDTTDSYALKYARIALQETAGTLADSGKIPTKSRIQRGSPIPDIDPSFPERPSILPIAIPNWVASSPADNKDWLESGTITLPDEVLRRQSIAEFDGPWVAVDGFLQTTDDIAGRRTFGIVRGILVPRRQCTLVASRLRSEEYLGNMFIPDEPSDYNIFAGEIPWSDDFATDEDFDDETKHYKGRIGGTGTFVEVLSHRYGWESYHSCANRACGSLVPSKKFSERFSLRALPSSFNQVDSSGKMAAISFSPPKAFDPEGNLLYLREDLLLQYASEEKQELLWAAWGERNLTHFSHTHPEWCYEIYQRHGHIWRRILLHSELNADPTPARSARSRGRPKKEAKHARR